jgi:hypothetical protein
MCTFLKTNIVANYIKIKITNFVRKYSLIESVQIKLHLGATMFFSKLVGPESSLNLNYLISPSLIDT